MGKFVQSRNNDTTENNVVEPLAPSGSPNPNNLSWLRPTHHLDPPSRHWIRGSCCYKYSTLWHDLFARTAPRELEKEVTFMFVSDTFINLLHGVYTEHEEQRFWTEPLDQNKFRTLLLKPTNTLKYIVGLGSECAG